MASCCAQRSSPIKQHDESPVLGTALHGSRAHHDVAEADYATDMMKGHLEFRLFFHLHSQRVMVGPQVRTLGRHIERVQQLMHVSILARLERRTLLRVNGKEVTNNGGCPLAFINDEWHTRLTKGTMGTAAIVDRRRKLFTHQHGTNGLRDLKHPRPKRRCEFDFPPFP
jgi:hypothetical protein